MSEVTNIFKFLDVKVKDGTWKMDKIRNVRYVLKIWFVQSAWELVSIKKKIGNVIVNNEIEVGSL